MFFLFLVRGLQSPLHQMLIITLSEIRTDLKSNQNENIFQLLLNESWNICWVILELYYYIFILFNLNKKIDVSNDLT